MKGLLNHLMVLFCRWLLEPPVKQKARGTSAKESF